MSRCVIAIRVTPRSSKPGFGDWPDDGELEVRVSAPPADGEANAALIKLLSKALGVPKSSIDIVAGEASRHKRLSVPLDRAEVAARLRRQGGAASTDGTPQS